MRFKTAAFHVRILSARFRQFLREVRLLLESHDAHDITISYVLNGGEEK